MNYIYCRNISGGKLFIINAIVSLILLSKLTEAMEMTDVRTLHSFISRNFLLFFKQLFNIYIKLSWIREIDCFITDIFILFQIVQLINFFLSFSLSFIPNWKPCRESLLHSKQCPLHNALTLSNVSSFSSSRFIFLVAFLYYDAGWKFVFESSSYSCWGWKNSSLFPDELAERVRLFIVVIIIIFVPFKGHKRNVSQMISLADFQILVWSIIVRAFFFYFSTFARLP